jgi:hypothetical protein
VRQILAEADENDDDVIQYKEFLPIMVDILQSIKASSAIDAAIAQPQIASSASRQGPMHGAATPRRGAAPPPHLSKRQECAQPTATTARRTE